MGMNPQTALKKLFELKAVLNRLAETVELNGRSSSHVDLKVGPKTRPDFEIRATTGDIEILPVKALAKE